MGIELAAELQRAEDERRTGVLCVGDGTFHLTEGAVTCVDCQRTPGLDRLVIAAGVATAETWRDAIQDDPDRILGAPRLETIALLAVFDAAFFLLASPGVPQFQPAPPHWLAPVCRIPPHTLVNECARRSHAESGPWPAELVDRAPVVPVRRVRHHRVVLTGSQAEVLATADARRSVTGIADDLGRTSYGCLVAVRELTTAGLIERPNLEVLEGKPTRGVRPPIEPAAELVVSPPARTRQLTLPQRRPHREMIPEPPDRWDAADRDLLTRLRTALEELD
ncbi:hypothetical protein AB0H76_29940 [Nocardia sp. NPDC050712]|uniref:hypothetical protein n=1 Tax=Nocardia sp. NPDC050712 TaxID=3155518 RepID=UPI0033D442AC